MLLRLQTLKAKPPRQQVETIEALTDQNLVLYDRLKPLFCRASRDSILGTRLSRDRAKVVRVALLAVMAADVAGVPDARTRSNYRRRLEKLCQHLDVDYSDVAAMVAHARVIEEILDKAVP